jgi:hypothetical protein
MAITGGVKFFEKSQCLAVDGATGSASSGDASAAYALDNNKDTKWRSSGANDDTISVTFQVNFDSSKTINRILIRDHNWKDFNIKYDVAGAWTHFASVVGLDGSKANITETAFADNTAYYEFSQVTTTKILVTVTKTQTADQEKYASQIIATSELGTFVGYPNVKEVALDRNLRATKTVSGKYVVDKSIEVVSFDFVFRNYPSSSTYNADMDLVMTLQDREDPFLVWLCGARRGTSYFRYTNRGFRLKDIYNMQITKAIKIGYVDNIYFNGLNAKLELDEHV